MKYTKEQRLNIGRQIYEGEISRFQAAKIYNINETTARSYMRMYRAENQLPQPKPGRRKKQAVTLHKMPIELADLEAYERMSKEELILELIKVRMAEVK